MNLSSCSRLGLLLIVLTFGCRFAGTEAYAPSSKTAAEARLTAVEALDRIENGDDPGGAFSGGTRFFAQSLAAARALLGQGSSAADARRRAFAADESEQFLAAYRRFLKSGSKDDRIATQQAMSGVQWSYFIFGRNLAADENATATLEGLTLKDVPAESVDAVFWALTERAPKAWPKAARDVLPRLAEALTERLARAPAIDPAQFRSLKKDDRDTLDVALLTRLRGASLAEPGLRASHVRLTDLISASMITDGKTALDVAKDAVESVTLSDSPSDAWGRVVDLSVAAQDLAAVNASDRPRQANGRMLQAYVQRQIVAKSESQQTALGHWLNAYLRACSEVHPVHDEVSPALSDTKPVQEDVLMALLKLVPDAQDDFLDKARASWRGDIVLPALAVGLSHLGGVSDPNAFHALVHGFDDSVSAHGELAPMLLALGNWRS